MQLLIDVMDYYIYPLVINFTISYGAYNLTHALNLLTDNE